MCIRDRYLTLMRLANKALEHAPINERRRKEGKLPANGIWLWAEGKAEAAWEMVNSHDFVLVHLEAPDE